MTDDHDPDTAIGHPEAKQVRLRWPNETEPIAVANQFAVQLSPAPDGGPEAVILIIGQAAPPLLSGTPEEQAADLESMTEVPVVVLSRVSLARGQVDQLMGILEVARQRWDVADGDMGATKHDGK